jgi:DNA polymerase beta palm
VLDVLQCRDAPDAHKFFAFAVGSYCRGKPATGDIDFLIIPPASVGHANFMGPLLRYLLKVVSLFGSLAKVLASINFKRKENLLKKSCL